MENPPKVKIIKVTVGKEEKKYSYMPGNDCPIFHALKNAGVSVRQVGSEVFSYERDGHFYGDYLAVPRMRKYRAHLIRTDSSLLRRFRRSFTFYLAESADGILSPVTEPTGA